MELEEKKLRGYKVEVLRESQAIARTSLMVALDPTNRSMAGGRICHMKQ